MSYQTKEPKQEWIWEIDHDQICCTSNDAYVGMVRWTLIDTETEKVLKEELICRICNNESYRKFRHREEGGRRGQGKEWAYID